MPRRIHPIWPTWVALLGLVLAFFGERVLVADGSTRWVLDAVAGLALVVATAVRVRAFLGSTPPARPIARDLALCTAGLLLGLGLYALIPATSGSDLSKRTLSVVWALWPIVIAGSLLPLLAMEIAVAPVAYNPGYEVARVRGAARRGLGLALTLAVMFFANFLLSRHDAKWELSAGSQAVASQETERAVRDLTKDVRVVAFWPKANEVGDVVVRYLTDLSRVNPRLTVERRDHALASKLASEIGVTENGWIGVIQDGANKKIRIGEKARTSRSALRRLDRDFLKALLEVSMKKRVAYFTTGHGERAVKRVDQEDRRSPVKLMREQLEAWQFTVKPLGVAEGLTEAVPDDASVVMILGPERPFLPAEIDVLKRALERGVRILIALEAERDGEALDGLLAPLGLRFDRTVLANERANAPLTRTEADRRFIWSNRYSSHPSVTSMSRNSRLATVLGSAGSLVDLEGDPPLPKAKLDVVLTAVDDTFRDVDSDLTRDANEPAQNYPLAAAITRTSTRGKTAETRAFVIADVDVFADELMKLVQGNLMLFRDVIYWLQVDQQAIVPTVSEKDVRIVHKAEDDAILFYGTTFGAPLLVLAAGFFATRRRRRR